MIDVDCTRIAAAIISWDGIDGWTLEYELPESKEWALAWLNLPDDASDAKIIAWVVSNKAIQEAGLTGRIHLWREGKPTGIRIELRRGQVI